MANTNRSELYHCQRCWWVLGWPLGGMRSQCYKYIYAASLKIFCESGFFKKRTSVFEYFVLEYMPHLSTHANCNSAKYFFLLNTYTNQAISAVNSLTPTSLALAAAVISVLVKEILYRATGAVSV